MRTPATHARDEALRQLGRLNRWLIAGSIVVTGALTEVAANAFPGKTIKALGKTGHSAQKSSSSSATRVPLSPPSQAPQAAAEPPSQETQQAAPSQEAGQAQPPRETGQSQPSQGAQPARETQQSTPPQESSTPPQQAAPETSAPVVSGGS